MSEGGEKKPGKQAGPIRQWGATLGAPVRSQESERSDAQEVSISEVQTPSILAAQESGHSEVQESRRSDVEASNSPEVQESERSGAQKPKRSTTRASKQPDAQKSKRSGAQIAERSTVQASEKEQRNKQTVYLELEVDRWIRHRVADTREEISDVINLAVRQLMGKKS